MGAPDPPASTSFAILVVSAYHVKGSFRQQSGPGAGSEPADSERGGDDRSKALEELVEITAQSLLNSQEIGEEEEMERDPSVEAEDVD